MKIKEMMPVIENMFRTLDVDNNGELDLEELLKAPDAILDQLHEVSDMEHIEELFRCLDYDCTGTLSINEFCSGIIRTQSEKPIELLGVMRQCSDILKELRRMA